MSRFKIGVLDSIAPEGIAMLESEPECEFEVRTGLKGDALRTALNEFDGVIIRSGVKITGEALEGNKRLRAIVRAGVGTDNIDKQAATRLGIVVMNTPSGNTLSTAEHAFALMLALARNIAPAYQALCEGRWDRKSYMGTQLADKTLGVVGMGRIGREVATRALAFRMKVLAYDPFLTEEQATKLGVERVETVDEMLPQVDFLTVHTPLTEETRNLIDRPQLEKLKPGVRLINCARGGIFNEAALVEGLQSNRIGGVALDVYESEPCTDSPLFGMPGVVCTPHLGASTEEAQTQVAVEGVGLLLSYLKTGEIRHAVNVAAIDPKTLNAIRSQLDVAYRLGLFLAQWHGGSIDRIGLTYRGDVADRETNLLTSAFCAGLLERAMEEEINIINAQVLLRERGIELDEHRTHDKGAFSSSIAASVRGGGQTAKAGGTVFGHHMPRLVMVDDYRLESYLDGHLLVFTHQDVPGIIGKVGTVFGEHGINIAQMAVGRADDSPGGHAIGVLNLDSPPSEQSLKELLEIPAIQRVQPIELPPAGSLPPWLQ